uniref:Predicted protein n=1 Tax=Hordeum vulgare subsp. vulgare TaxID=112509 RepID=F2DPV5_HORVV|nr:predicted protein [Hordeum vulgare subsp. vulgare]
MYDIRVWRRRRLPPLGSSIPWRGAARSPPSGGARPRRATLPQAEHDHDAQPSLRRSATTVRSPPSGGARPRRATLPQAEGTGGNQP